MKTSSICFAAAVLAFGFGMIAVASPGMWAQAQQGQQPTPVVSGVDSLQTQLHMLTDVQRQGIDSGQQKAYKAFYAATDLDKRIRLGNEFLQRYPKSALDEGVEVGLTNVYYAKQDWNDFYATADKALALNPDEVDVLTTVGWVIPHEYDPNQANAEQLLSKAEGYEKHALDILAKMSKPKGMADKQFTALKAQKEQQAHSALGLVYFRRGDYANSIIELRQATQATDNPDQTDLYVLGVDLQNLNQHAEAAAAFTRCSQLSGSLQAQCQEAVGRQKK